ncbi:MAG: cupin domain-containing protein [Spirochaetales bacterium]|nr:cupin domain-containing protein [Spirochaetales bacterium]
MDVLKVEKKNARNFMEGVEHCREYLQTDKIVFGTSELLPGQRGAKDVGHPDSHEVFYVSRGHVLMFVEEQDRYFELNEGDCILMPEGVSHTLINIGNEKAVITWTMAPPER